MVDELECKVKPEKLVILRKSFPLFFQLAYILLGMILLFSLRDFFAENSIYFWSLFAPFFFGLSLVTDLWNARMNSPILSINKKQGTVIYENEIIGKISEISAILLEEESEDIADATTHFEIKLEFNNHTVLSIHSSAYKKEQEAVAWVIGNFVEKPFFELNAFEGAERKAERRHQRLVIQLEEKYSSQDKKELQLLLENQSLLADYAIEAIENLLRQK